MATFDYTEHGLERLKTMRNGEKRDFTFSDEEFENRLAGLRQTMARFELDAVVLTSYQNIKYYTDYLLTSWGRLNAVVVSQDSAITVTGNVDAAMPWRHSYATDNIVFTDWQEGNFYYGVQEALKRAGVNARRLGIEEDDITVVQRREFDDAFPDVTFIDVAPSVTDQRMIKSAEEIALFKEAARIADVGGYAVRDQIREGITEYELSLIGVEAMTHEIAKSFPNTDLRDSWVWFTSGVNTDGAHSWPTTRKLRTNELLSLNTFPMVSGYYTGLERTMFLGEPDEATLKYWQLNLDIHLRGLELVKPGASAKEISAELNQYYIDTDLMKYRHFGYGHSFGIMSHYYGRDGGVEFRERSDTRLEPGMIVSMEPMIGIPDGLPGAGGYREHDILIITEDGADNITGFPLGPELNTIRP